MSTPEEREARRLAKTEARMAKLEAGARYLEKVAGLAARVNAGEIDIISAIGQAEAPAVAHVFKVS